MNKHIQSNREIANHGVMFAPDFNPRASRSHTAGYKEGVEIIYGIPYTREEQNIVMSHFQIKDAIIALCRVHRVDPNLSVLSDLTSGTYHLPDANDIISYAVHQSIQAAYRNKQ